MSGNDTKSDGPHGDVAELLRDSDAFVRCPDCQTLVVRLGPHRCGPDDEPTPARSREERTRAAAADSRSDDDLVGIVQRAAGSAYAYHELDDDGEALCNCDERPDVKGFEVVTRAEARHRGRAPCGNCERFAHERTRKSGQESRSSG